MPVITTVIVRMCMFKSSFNNHVIPLMSSSAIFVLTNNQVLTTISGNLQKQCTTYIPVSCLVKLELSGFEILSGPVASVAPHLSLAGTDRTLF